jgi:hypothetical protein
MLRISMLYFGRPSVGRVDLSWLYLACAFMIGSIWFTLTTIAAERFGSKVGGFIGGLPSAAVVSFFSLDYLRHPITAFAIRKDLL